MTEGAESLRVFIAVAATSEVRDAAERELRALRGKGDVRWVTADRLHLTLKFLGDTPGERVPLILDALQKIANNFSPFVLELREAGAFPNLRKPQTLWLGIGGEEELCRLVRSLDEELGALGFEREKRGFKPHLTLGRLRSSRGVHELVEALEAVRSHSGPAIDWPVTELHLVKSELRPAGPEYTILGSVSLSVQEERSKGVSFDECA